MSMAAVIWFIVQLALSIAGGWIVAVVAYKAGVRDGVRLEVERSLREGGKGGT